MFDFNDIHSDDDRERFLLFYFVINLGAFLPLFEIMNLLSLNDQKRHFNCLYICKCATSSGLLFFFINWKFNSI